MDVAPPPLDPRQRSVLGAAPDDLVLTESLQDVIDRVSRAWHDEVRALNVPNAHPLVYRFGPDGRPMRRGGHYLDPPAARATAERIAREGGT